MPRSTEDGVEIVEQENTRGLAVLGSDKKLTNIQMAW